MSYAQAAAQGANQSAEEARAPIPPQPASTASSSLVDVDSPHVSTVPSDFESQAVKTETQAERLEREEEGEEEEAARGESEQHPGSGKAATGGDGGGGKGKSKEKTTEKGREKVRAGKERVKAGAHEAKERAREVAEHGKERAEGCVAKLSRNRSNPVVVANALLIAAAGGIVGYHAYERHLKGLLTWEVVATWGGAIGVGVGVDYWVSKWLLQNKYPPK